MADHIITLNNKQENAAARIVARSVDPLTVDEWIFDLVIGPIRAEIVLNDAMKVQTIVTALPDATNAQLNQIRVILGIT